MRTSLLLACLLILIGVCQPSLAQLVPRPVPPFPESQSSDGTSSVRVPKKNVRLVEESYFPWDDSVVQRDQLSTAMEKYRNAKADSQVRAEAKEEIEKALGEQYDANLTAQERQLNQMEKRLADLRRQIKARRDAKEKMVSLKLEMVLAQLEGLGWPEGGDESWSGVGERDILRRYSLETATAPDGFNFGAEAESNLDADKEK